MATLSTLAHLMLAQDPGIQPYSDALLKANRIQGGTITNQSALLDLEERRRQQASVAQEEAFLRQHPELALGGGMPQSILGGLQAAPGGAPPPGPIVQQPFGPGGVTGPAQTIPAPMQPNANLGPSGAMPGGAPQSTLATLGPPGQATPLVDLMRRDPRAALAVQQRLQAQQAQQFKWEEQRLDIGVKVSEALARQLQGVTDQASLDAARERVRLIHPQAAAQIPQFYSKEALEAIQQRGQAAAERAKTQLDEAKARRLDIETQYFPQMMEETNAPVPAQTPAGGTSAPTARRPATASPAFETAITDANRLYPQVSTTRIKSIIAAESNFDPHAVSSAGAKGPMQLMDATAKDMGVTDPFDMGQNVRGGTRYYAQLLTKYGGDERKALTAYNWGPANLDKVGGDVSKAPPETQAYVAKVLGGGGGGTAQATATDPRMAQLEAQIAQRTRQAKQASLFGNESLSTRLNDEVNRLTAEKTRLEERASEIPRAVEKEQALQPLRLEQQGEAERIRAASERASQSELDAINRSRPEGQKIPYGTTRAELRERGLVGGEKLSDTVLEGFTDRAVVVRQLGELSTKLGDMPTGPWAGRVEAFRQRFGIDVKDEAVAFRTILSAVHNQLALARGGKALTPQEITRIEKELPTESDPDVTFRSKLKTAAKLAEDIYRLKAQFYRKAGHGVPEALMSPWDDENPKPPATAPQVSSNVDKFKAIKP